MRVRVSVSVAIVPSAARPSRLAGIFMVLRFVRGLRLPPCGADPDLTTGNAVSGAAGCRLPRK
ncbi:hypothetical protein GCM10023205_01360 [Yinghuangia aomiensis]|uniref:Uncharacterized protein n=1 Tax=Yinghuangia aomiensis TaxID=676205 RepID=A0ABP9GN57_9ACTN